MRRDLALLLVLLLAPFAACRKGGDPVLRTIQDLEAAVDDRDADAAGGLLAAAYADAEHADRNAALLTIRRYFSAYESVSATFSDLEVERKPDLARAVFTAKFDGSPRKLGSLDALLPRTAKVRFEMNLVPEDGRWKVAWAGWRLEDHQEGP